MNVFIHYPKTNEDMKILNIKIAKIHIEAIKEQINELECPKSQKVDLLNQIFNAVE